MTVTEAAAVLGITPGAVRFRIARGDLHAERVGARVLLIPTAEVERVKGLGKLKPGPKPGTRRRRAQDG